MPYRTAAVIYQQSQRLTVQALATIAIAVGVAILIGGPERFDHAPSLTVASQVPGGWLTWGVTATAIGAWTLFSSRHWEHRRGVMLGLLAQSIFFSFWTVTIGVSSYQQPFSPLTGIAVYGGYSVACSICYVAGHELRKAGAP